MNKKVNENLTRKNTGRRRASLLMFFTFILLVPSGIMMHLNDIPGSSHERFHAMVVHNICAVLFVISGIFHMKYNFNLIKKYITDTWNDPANK